MSRNPFAPTPDTLPRRLPIFPLAGVLLLPRAKLPLNIFEPRYLRMVEAALAGDRMIGMVQPVDPDCIDEAPMVYQTGCAGRITSFTETDDGRLLVTLTGVSRFTIAREVDPVRGYRLVEPTWDGFAHDFVPLDDAGIDRCRLLANLRCYFKYQGLTADWHHMECTPDERLIHALSMICPFSPGEKQALLEAPDLAQRAKLLIAFVEMAILGCGDGAATDKPRH